MRGQEATSPEWTIEDGVITLRLPGGETLRPTASEIAGAEYKQRLNIRGHEVACRPSATLVTIRFHRFPPDAVLDLTPPSSDLSVPPTCRIRIAGVDSEPPQGVDQFLSGNDWYPLPVDVLESIRALLSEIGVTGSLTVKQYLLLRRRNSDLITVGREPAAAYTKPREDPPQHGLQATLYPYQANGFRWLSRIADEELGCVLGDEMGLGKTLQVIALLLRESTRGTPSLVIAPTTLLENWRRELERFAPTLKVCVHRGSSRTGYPRILADFNVVLTSYDTAVRDISILEMVRWNIVVMDEAQAIKTPDTQRARTLKAIPRRVAIAVTGTPVENRLRDLWSLMDFAVPEFLGELEEFERSYADDDGGAASLEPLVSPLILRRTVAEVATDLPGRIDIPQAIELSDKAAGDYDAVRHAIIAQYGASATLVALTKLRMYCCHPFLTDHGTGDPLPHSSKYARLVEILDEVFERGDKVLIFTSYQEMSDILVADLHRRYSVPVAAIDGRTPIEDRQPVVDRFGAAASSAALVLNPKAAGTGLNITAATHVIHYNLEWNPATEDQATARAYRRGQTRPVTVHRLFHPGTVEEVIDQRLQRKRALASNAVVGTEGADADLADVFAALNASPMLRENA